MRCDLHVHTRHSGMCNVPGLSAVCRESYNDPQAVYQRLKARGMDLVTVTDHDSIDAAESLRGRPDFFLSEEVSCRLPDGTYAHLGVYDITERDHVEMQRRATDFFSLVAYLRERRLFFSANHIFSPLTGSRTLADFAWLDAFAAAIETRNGTMPAINNRRAARFAQFAGKPQVGGSDAHTLVSLGATYSEVPEAASKEEFLQGLRAGRSRVAGEHGSYWKLTRDVLLIALAMFGERPQTAWLAPLLLAVPAVTLGSLAWEHVFGGYWMARLSRDRARARLAASGEPA
jgi:predicted metal-dependent phosphoesterase TrpH